MKNSRKNWLKNTDLPLAVTVCISTVSVRSAVRSDKSDGGGVCYIKIARLVIQKDFEIDHNPALQDLPQV